METTFTNGQTPFGKPEDARTAFDRTNEKSKKARSQKIDKELKDTIVQIDQTKLEYGEIAVAQEVAVVKDSDGLPYPVPISEHKSKSTFLLVAMVALYGTSLGLLSLQLFSTLDLDPKIIFVIVILVASLMAVVLPLFISVFFKVTPKNPESKEPVEKIFFISFGLGILAFIAFSMTRATSETEGVMVTIYSGSLPITELMAATAGACCHVLRKYYSWSMELSRKFRKLDLLADKLRNEMSKLKKDGDSIIEAPSQD